MNLTKLAKGGLIVTLLGAIAVGSVAYTSKGTDIKGFIDDLRAKALGWKDVAEHNKAEYNKLKAVYDEMLKLLGLQEGATYEQIKAKIDNLVKNADVAGIDNVNDLLYTLATSLGVQDQLVKDANGVYNPQPIYDALKTLEDDLDTAIAKIGDTEKGIDTNAKGEVTYRDDMTLVEKINYLIAQVNNANDDQIAIKEYANEAVNGKINESGEVVKEAIASPTDDDKVTSPIEKPKDEASDGDVASGSDPEQTKTPKQQAWEAFAKTVDEETRTKIADGTWIVNRNTGVVSNNKTGSVQFTLSSDKLALYNTWYNMAE